MTLGWISQRANTDKNPRKELLGQNIVSLIVLGPIRRVTRCSSSDELLMQTVVSNSLIRADDKVVGLILPLSESQLLTMAAMEMTMASSSCGPRLRVAQVCAGATSRSRAARRRGTPGRRRCSPLLHSNHRVLYSVQRRMQGRVQGSSLLSLV